jgi:hypothetical protein
MSIYLKIMICKGWPRFKKGDKVLCVDPPEGHRTLIAGEVYTVTLQEEDYVYLDELGRGGWWAKRFQLSQPVPTARNGREHKRMFRLENNVRRA